MFLPEETLNKGAQPCTTVLQVDKRAHVSEVRDKEGSTGALSDCHSYPGEEQLTLNERKEYTQN